MPEASSIYTPFLGGGPCMALGCFRLFVDFPAPIQDRVVSNSLHILP